MMHKPILFCLIVLMIATHTHAQENNSLKVHFLYGSKPARKYKRIEKKYFGGIKGGHVGIESEENKILNFIPKGKFHWIARREDKHSEYTIDSKEDFYHYFGDRTDSSKYAIIHIPITSAQKRMFDSIAAQYLRQTPYDYAFWGMRCGAASYEILGQLGVLKKYGHHKTYRKIFYPKKLRKRLLKKARKHNWFIERQEGTHRRKWEKDG
jgi:hypothetical protein